ncbi:MAG: hypothetical protein HZA79_00155 [Sphingobacteriales bacterium]|nr:hypothetical protein [Sphingobacteriales bacterium]
MWRKPITISNAADGGIFDNLDTNIGLFCQCAAGNNNFDSSILAFDRSAIRPD